MAIEENEMGESAVLDGSDLEV